tara:strand:+ start:132 stop:575 length:444 start_codon:yes stop_codon:yes gene_type:complete
MNLYEYVAVKNPVGAKTVLNSFGVKAVRRPDILSRQLANSVNKYGKEALFRIAAIHPDLQLVTEYNKAVAVNNGESNEKYCQCGKKKEEKESLFSSAEGQEIKKAVEDLSLKTDSLANTPKETKSDKTELMIIGAVVLVGLALVMKK